MISRAQILYIESVDGRTFVYTSEDVLQVDFTLAQLEHILNTVNFFRCSKSMILNIDKVTALKSLASNRINATMCNGEHILISRTYASDLDKLEKSFVFKGFRKMLNTEMGEAEATQIWQEANQNLLELAGKHPDITGDSKMMILSSP